MTEKTVQMRGNVEKSKRIAAHRRANRSGSRVANWLGAVILLGLAGAAAWFLWGSKSLAATTTAAGGPDYHTTTVQRGDLSISASGSGTLVASQSVDLSFSARGTVAALNVKLGDQVKAGDVLARLGDAQNLEANIASAQLQLLQAQQALATLQQNSSAALAQSYQAYIQAQQDYNTALNTNQRMAYARCSKAVTTKYAAQVDNYTQKLGSMSKDQFGTDAWISVQNALDTAQANLTYCQGYTDAEKANSAATLQAAQVTMQQAEQKYNTLKTSSGIDPNTLAIDEAQVKQAQTQLAQAQKDLQGVTLVAPIDGTVMYLAAGQGALVDTSTFITIADRSHPTVQVSIDETDLSKLANGSSAEVTFDALPGQTFAGKVVEVNPKLITSGQYQVAQGLVELDSNAANSLQNTPLGLSASVTVIEKQVKNAVLVPVSALRDLGNQEYAVFVVSSRGKLQLRPVKVGLMDTTHAEILSGLQPGEVISTGQVQGASQNTSQNAGSR